MILIESDSINQGKAKKILNTEEFIVQQTLKQFN